MTARLYSPVTVLTIAMRTVPSGPGKIFETTPKDQTKGGMFSPSTMITLPVRIGDAGEHHFCLTFKVCRYSCLHVFQ